VQAGAQNDQICATSLQIIDRSPAAQIGGSVRRAVVITEHAA
jgi:hypothetical protein